MTRSEFIECLNDPDLLTKTLKKDPTITFVTEDNTEYEILSIYQSKNNIVIDIQVKE